MSSPNYPNAYCVKCGAHTNTTDKHTVLLANQSRAVKGVCPDCGSENYKIIPPKSAPSPAYPNAYCVKCRDHTPTAKAHTVVLENQSRALTGKCGKCGSDVYRILAAKDSTGAESASAATPDQGDDKRPASFEASLASRAADLATTVRLVPPAPGGEPTQKLSAPSRPAPRSAPQSKHRGDRAISRGQARTDVASLAQHRAKRNAQSMPAAPLPSSRSKLHGMMSSVGSLGNEGRLPAGRRAPTPFSASQVNYAVGGVVIVAIIIGFLMLSLAL